MEENICIECGGKIVGPDNIGSHDNRDKCIRVLQAKISKLRAELDRVKGELDRATSSSRAKMIKVGKRGR